MFRLEQLREPGSDCTAPYDMIFDKEYTVEEFVKAVLSNTKEWGGIRIRTDPRARYFDQPKFEYRYGELKDTIPDDILHKRVTLAEARGGWSLMDYFLYISD